MSTPTHNPTGLRAVFRQAEVEIVEKKSRFIASVLPIRTEAEGLAFLESLRKKHYNASHNCYAYQLGERHELQRFSDDGEPGGTAGMPILNVLQAEDIHNAIVVVTRYFGGTMLGAGGLVRAYTRAAHDGLTAACIITKRRYARLIVEADYGLAGKIQYGTLQAGHIIHDTAYTDSVRFTVLVAAAEAEGYATLVQDLTAATATVTEDGFVYGAEVEGEVVLFGENGF